MCSRLTLLGCLLTASHARETDAPWPVLSYLAVWAIDFRGKGLLFVLVDNWVFKRCSKDPLLTFPDPKQIWLLSDVIGRVTCETLTGNYKKKQEYKSPCEKLPVSKVI